jgi:hypothetical protein
VQKAFEIQLELKLELETRLDIRLETRNPTSKLDSRQADNRAEDSVEGRFRLGANSRKAEFGLLCPRRSDTRRCGTFSLVASYAGTSRANATPMPALPSRLDASLDRARVHSIRDFLRQLSLVDLYFWSRELSPPLAGVKEST